MGKSIQLDFTRDESERGFRLTLPRPIPGSLLDAVALRFGKRIVTGDAPIHLFAIANSGVPMAAAILAQRQSTAHVRTTIGRRQVNDVLTIVVPDQHELIPRALDSSAVPIIFDNSVRSGCTVEKIVETMRRNKFSVNQMVTLVDYGDAQDAAIKAKLRRESGINLFSLFDISEIAFDDPRGVPNTYPRFKKVA